MVWWGAGGELGRRTLGVNGDWCMDGGGLEMGGGMASENSQELCWWLRRGIYLCGHSAGGHLAAMMLACEFAEDDAFDSEMIKGAALISGVYDLRPLTKTYVNDPLKLNEEDAWRFSPANFIAEIAGLSQQRDILIAVAEYDPPEFRRQSADLEKELSARKVKTRYMDVSDTDHFDVIEKLQKDSYRLTTELLRLMKLS
ncbi:kynurenine formamidase-like [Haliotis rubra]|uniref:kynurenine formamidase-like n=1 Tax=Haliotis rubra TaxID=36100 RepID=UPI001EE5019A|nr:kynurenine formamidase-like [Haliotis rubra]